VLPGLLTSGGIDRLRAAFEPAVGDGPTGGAAARPAGARHVDLLAGPDPAFEAARSHHRVLAAVRHVLGRPFRVFQIGARDPLPGYGRQGLHADWLPRARGDPFSVVTAIWLLDDFTAANGAARLVPGTHVLTGPVPGPLRDPSSRHPGATIVVATAGSALVFNGHLRNGGARNGSAGPRRAIQCQFIARDAAPPAETAAPAGCTRP
jgi:ectoine hydroxylase-related dioxygenase (phytanoyl-CoA dioxygenase family)